MKSISFLSCLLFLRLAAADSPAVLQLQLLSLQEDAPETLHLQSGDTWHALPVSFAHLEDPVSLPFSERLQLHLRPGTAEDGAAAAPAAQVELPLHARTVVLLLLREGGVWQLTPLLLKQNTPVGSFFLINRSGLDLRILLGEVEADLPAAGQLTIPTLQPDRGIVPFQWQAANAPETLTNPTMTTSWFYNPNRWTFVILETIHHTLSVRSVTRFPAAPAP